MKQYKKIFPVAIVGLGLLLAGCGSQSNNQKSSMKNSNSTSQVQKHSTSSSQNSNSNSSSESNSSNNANNDSRMPQTNSSNVTKSINGDHKNFTAKYNKSNKQYAQFTKKTYNNNKKAQAQVGYQDPSINQGLPATNLGYNIKGYQQGGAGQTYMTFYMGRWSITIHSSSNVVGGTTAEDYAKHVVAYLQNHSLPVPENQGAININVDSSNDNSVNWQDNNSVYHLNGHNQDTLLRMATAIK